MQATFETTMTYEEFAAVLGGLETQWFFTVISCNWVHAEELDNDVSSLMCRHRDYTMRFDREQAWRISYDTFARAYATLERTFRTYGSNHPVGDYCLRARQRIAVTYPEYCANYSGEV